MIQFVPVTAAYAALLTLMYLGLSWNVVSNRRQLGVGRGDDGHESLARAIRIHANFIEYVPLALVLMVLLELNGATAIVVHLLGSALVIARGLHAWGMSQTKGLSFGRFYGTSVTWLVLLAGAALNLYVGFA